MLQVFFACLAQCANALLRHSSIRKDLHWERSRRVRRLYSAGLRSGIGGHCRSAGGPSVGQSTCARTAPQPCRKITAPCTAAKPLPSSARVQCGHTCPSSSPASDARHVRDADMLAHASSCRRSTATLRSTDLARPRRVVARINMYMRCAGGGPQPCRGKLPTPLAASRSASTGDVMSALACSVIPKLYLPGPMRYGSCTCKRRHAALCRTHSE